MKTPEEITRWCDMMLKRHPNIEDTNFFNSIKDYMKEQRPQGESYWVMQPGKTASIPPYYIWKCKYCGRDAFTEKPIAPDVPCPNCGADMRGENKFNDLVVFDDQPKRQLETPDCHNEL